MLGAFEDPLDWVEMNGVSGKVVNPAQVGGGVVREKLVDTSMVDIDAKPSRKEGDGKWMVQQVVRNELGRTYGNAHLRQQAATAFLPPTSHHRIYQSKNASLEKTRELHSLLTSTTQPIQDTTIETASLQTQLATSITPHPLFCGPAVTPEDRLSLEMEADRRSDAQKRLKYEVFSNKIAQRTNSNQFKGDSRDPAKSLHKFFYDGDDLQFLPDKPIWRQKAEQRQGSTVAIGKGLDATNLRNFQRYIRRVSQLGSPETMGDLQKMVAEQRNLMVELKNEEFKAGHRYTAMLNRREAFMRRRGQSPNILLKDAITKELPLVERIMNKRKDDPKKVLTPDEAFELAAHDIADARKLLSHQRDRIKNDNWADDRETKLLPAGSTPITRVPEYKRATTWLSEYYMPGEIEDPRVLSPFALARDASTPLTSELKGRSVGPWEANDGAGVPGAHRVIAEKIGNVFDYQRAVDRVSLGLQEKAVSDWRPTKSVDEEAFKKSAATKGAFDRRPIGFWSRENPDLRTTTEWDDVLGAPVAQDGQTIDRIRFYQVRARWEKRKELAIKFGLEPKKDETIEERDIRRKELDERLQRVVVNQSEDSAVLSAWSDDRKLEQWYGKRKFQAEIGDRSGYYPLSVRPQKDLLGYQALSGMSVSEANLSEERKAWHQFNRAWFRDDAEAADKRRDDPRVDYLSTAGIKGDRRHAVMCMHYMQVQDALWELRVYRGESEPGKDDRTWIEDTTFINMMDDKWAREESVKIEKELDQKLKEEYRTHGEKVATIVDEEASRAGAHDQLGWKSPGEIDKWRTTDGAKEGLEIEREMTYPIADVTNLFTTRWLAKTPWDRIAANDLAAKCLRPEDDARGAELGPSYYFNRNRLHYYRLPVQRAKAFGPELRELKFLSEKLVPHSMVRMMKNYYAVARHNMIPFFSNHVGKNGPKFMHTPKVSFDHIGLHDDLEDYIRVNPHLAKWEEM
eukprot:TRINITY_DN6384_c1_g1_i1.p1 TRINITY_DN6384_c1_g1~~TRINITY_DN6384_c1_g1_i1.p1  ORF type:complete len:1002 (+),score=306.93 TRINITY_DN6384_c1_g1_i1:108-3008(+)